MQLHWQGKIYQPQDKSLILIILPQRPQINSKSAPLYTLKGIACKMWTPSENLALYCKMFDSLHLSHPISIK